MKDRSALIPGLTKAGKEWLYDPLKIQPGDGSVFEMARVIGTAYNLSPVEALVAVLGALSLAVGAGADIQGPIGVRTPLSLQILVPAGVNPRFDRAYRHLCHSVIETYASDFGRGLDDTDKTLAVRKLQIENEFNQLSAPGVQAKMTPDQSEACQIFWRKNGARLAESTNDEFDIDSQRKCLLAEYAKVNRKASIFPFGDVIDQKVLSVLVEEKKEFCYGSYSPNGDALLHILESSNQEQSNLIRFLHSGLHGELFSHGTKLPIYPVVSVAWLASPETIRATVAKGMHTRMPGMLFVTPDTPNKSSDVPGVADELQEQWHSFVQKLQMEYRSTFYRRYIPEEKCKTFLLDADASAALCETSEWAGHFTSEPGHVRTMLGRSTEYVLKIAGLLNVEPNASLAISKKSIILATEIFRWLAKGTFETISQGETAVLARMIERIVERLKTDGPQSRRALVRSFHRLDYDRADQLLDEAIRSGKVHKDGKLYKASEA